MYLVTINYSTNLIVSDEGILNFIAVMNEATYVREVGGKYVVADKKFSIKPIGNDALVKEAQAVEKLDFDAVKAEAARNWQWFSDEQKRTAALTAELKVYKETCPHTKEEKPADTF